MITPYEYGWIDGYWTGVLIPIQPGEPGYRGGWIEGARAEFDCLVPRTPLAYRLASYRAEPVDHRKLVEMPATLAVLRGLNVLREP